ncbi:MAG: hypothetical protein RIF36_16690 [Imperialibacter sp.]|uniref:hypothetical protein n=1 Tax=Imperialibacter sp. TaxID=2038411 RepID=UPI0032EFD85C
MTLITPNLIQFEGKYYQLVRPFNLSSPKDVGLFIGRFASTDNPSGFLFTYMIEKDQLFLDTIFCRPGPPKGWKYKLLYRFKSYPPTINGVKPELDEASDGDFRYENLSVPLKYSGELIVGNSRYGMDSEIHPDHPGSYAELLTLTFEKGKLVQRRMH